MKRRSAWLSSTACALAAASAVAAPAAAKQQPARPAALPSFSHVQVISYPTGQTGFFDKESGKLFVYDSTLKNCVAVRQLRSLGEALKSLPETAS